mmetsp:Transcript_67938/g.76064  ORF Transcript_67938/g.76064 Transcript_67938/m.76064 type:complete len:88 (-) Transcript_67938:725-988(-)
MSEYGANKLESVAGIEYDGQDKRRKCGNAGKKEEFGQPSATIMIVFQEAFGIILLFNGSPRHAHVLCSQQTTVIPPQCLVAEQSHDR